MNCPICEHTSLTYPLEGAANPDPETFKFWKCGLCGHGFFRPGTTAKELAALYDQEYAQTYIPEEETESYKKRRLQYAEDVRLLLTVRPERECKVLDFGASTGQFLSAMPATWEKHGLEINQFEVQYVREKHPEIRMHSDLGRIDDQFDIITLRGVIEHLHDFKDLFDLFGKNLKKDGLVYICATPDFSSPCAVLYGGEWNQTAVPHHYHQFTQASIAILFGKHGFGLELLSHPYLETPYAAPEQDSDRFIQNCRRTPVKDTIHAYPGTMMSLVFRSRKDGGNHA